jgi:alpha-glucosidase
MAHDAGQSVDGILNVKCGGSLRVDDTAAGIWRLRAGQSGKFPEGGLERYGILASLPSASASDFATQEQAWTWRHEDIILTVARADGAVRLERVSEVLLEELPRAPLPERGFEIKFRLKPGECLYGLGDVGRQSIQRRGLRYEMEMKNVVAYLPIPFIMSSCGWAIFMNTTWSHTVDAGAADPDVLRIAAVNGPLDFFILVGRSMPDLLERFTLVTGRPTLLPAWAYGLTFVCDEREVRARDVLYEAYEFRRHGIPCDTIGLEPGWMEKRYDFSTDKEWSKERFHIPFWLKGNERSTFTAALKNMGFKLSLWLCCDYDLSEHEERQLRKSAKQHPPIATPLIQDERLKEAVYQDKLTKPGEPWFEHLKKFVDDGARAFKMDAGSQVMFHPDRRWKNGMDDLEMHNLYPMLLAKQMSRGYAEYTGKRPMIYTPAGYAGIQQYAATWAGDTGGGNEPLISLLNHGLCGHSNVTTDMEVWNEQGIHFGFLQTWCQALSWQMYNQPWFQGEKLLKMFADYARWRYRILPYIYSMAHLATRTGLPVMRAMPLAFPDDPVSDTLNMQYMLGDAFLTAVFTEKIHLPAGEWFDYWTGESLHGPADITAKYPDDRGGVLFARAGAIIPRAPVMDYFGHKSWETLELEIFPGARNEPFVLCEDDGETEAWRNGAVATTDINQTLSPACAGGGQGSESASGGVLTLTISPRRGFFDGMDKRRRYQLLVHCQKPSAVRVDGHPLSEWQYDEEHRVLAIPAQEAQSDRNLEVGVSW